MCRRPMPPTLPWADCLVQKAPRRTVVAHRVPSRRPALGPSMLPMGSASATARTAGPGDGPEVVRSLLASDLPWPPAGDVQAPEGVAFTAVSPFY